MGHYSYYPSRLLNKIIGTLLGCLTKMSYSNWSTQHEYHHQHSNDLNYNQFHQTAPLTVAQYNNLPKKDQLLYRIIYNKYILYTIIPCLYFLIYQRLVSRWYENILFFAINGSIYYLGGWNLFVIDMIVSFFSGSIGFMMLHAQHTFEPSYRDKNWNHTSNGLRGSSYLIVPRFLKYFFGGIEYHHIHHLNSKIPCYNLQKCHDENSELFTDVKHLTFYEVLNTLEYALYDEINKKFIKI